MKKATLILLLLTSLNCFAQNSALLGHSWYLQRLVINGQEYLYPFEGQSVNVDFTADTYSMHYPECVEVATNFQIEYTGADAFTLSGNFLILIGFCNNIAMMRHYYIYENENPVNFTYAISTENNHEVLAVTNPDGNQAFYSDTELAVENFNKQEISVFFNPENDALEFSGPDKNNISHLKIYNQLGQNLLSESNVENTLNVAALPNGVYFAQLSLHDGSTITQKFLKR